MRAVERRNRNEIERGQREVEQEFRKRASAGARQPRLTRRELLPPSTHEHDQRDAKKAMMKFVVDAGERDDDVAFLEVPVVARIDRNRLGAAERHVPAAPDEGHERKQDRHERIDVLDGIPGESAELIRRWIAVLEGRVAVRVFVRDHGEQEHRRDQYECLELVQGAGGLGGGGGRFIGGGVGRINEYVRAWDEIDWLAWK